MSIISKIEDWGNGHKPGVIIDVLRIALGLFITYKGATFVSNIESLQMSIEGVNMLYTGVAISHYVIFAHLLCGPLLAFGLLTRIMSLVQIPVLAGAVFFVNAPKGFMSVGSHMELEISIICLVGLLAMMIFGGGRYSIDELRRRERAAEQQANQF